MGSRVVIVVESHFSQTREMGRPKVLTFHPVTNRRQMWATRPLSQGLHKRLEGMLRPALS